MRHSRIVMMISLLALAPVLSACADFDVDKLDIFNLTEKKKLPGERRPVFPEGVPGVTQGVPPDLVKGYQRPAESTPAEETPEQKAAVTEKPKPKRQPKPQAAAQPAQQGGNAPWPSSPPQPGTFQR